MSAATATGEPAGTRFGGGGWSSTSGAITGSAAGGGAGAAALVRQVAAPEVRRGLLGVVTGVSGQLSALGLMATSAWLITTASLRPPILGLSVAIGAVQFFAIARGLGRYGERLASHDVALRMLARMRVWAFRCLEPLVPGGLAGGSGDALGRVVGDVDATQDLVVRIAIPLVIGLFTIVAAALIAFALLPSACLVLTAGLVLTGALLPLLARTVSRPIARPLAGERARVRSHVIDTVEGSADVLSFGARDQVLDQLDRLERAEARTARRIATVVGAAGGLSSLVAGVTTIGVIVTGAEAVGSQHLSGVVVATLAFVALASFDAISTLPESFARLDQVLGSTRRVAALGAVRPPVEEPDRPLPLPSGPATLALRRASVTYPTGVSPAFADADLELAPGRRIAVVGPSGAGKTTLSLALLRYVELSGGSVSFGGIDCTRLAGDDVRSRIAWAPQDPHLFATSVGANLRLAQPEATDNQLREVLDALALTGWLTSLPGGLRTVVGERGTTVSGGERQRLGLARVLLAARPIVVLDEPTAHLDDDTEQVVRQAVLDRCAGAAILWITHRLVGLEDFDEIVVLDGGRVAERGDLAALSAAGGALSALLADTA